MRHYSKSAVEDYRALDVRRLARSNVLQPGHCCLWAWWRDGEQVASINVKAESHAIRLTYSANGTPQAYSVRLERTPCHYGGNRVWFICPAVGCNRRVAKLYGGTIFACRHCHQLNYACQQSSKRDVGNDRSWRLRQKMGCNLGWMDIPAEYISRPKGRHQKTHAHDIARLQRYDAQAEASFAAVTAMAEAMLARRP